MARLNIEDTIDADPRFRRLVRLLNGNDNEALGLLIRFWRLAQKYWGEGEHLVPEEEFRLDGFEPILKSGLAEKRSGGIYARGSEERFAWYRQRKEASVRGGEANKRNFEEKKPEKPEGKASRRVKSVPSGEPKLRVRLPESTPPDSPLTLTLSPTLLTNKESSYEDSLLAPEATASLPDALQDKKVRRAPEFTSEKARLVARYISEYQKRYKHRPFFDGESAKLLGDIGRGVGYPRAELLVTAYLQLDSPKYLAKCHDVKSLFEDRFRIHSALEQGVAEPNKDFAWEKWKREFIARDDGDAVEPEQLEGGSNGQE